jgi:hypothetical protein
VRTRAARASGTLLAQYDAALGAHPGQSARLTPLRAAVARHVSALGGAMATAPASVSADPAEALRALATAERGTADAHTAALMAAPPELARLLASLAAAGAAHAYLLTEGPRS